MLEEDDGVVVLVGREQGIEGVLRVGGIDRLEAGEGEEGGLHFLRMERAERQSAAARETEDHRAFLASPEVIGGGVEDDLGRGVGGEVGELEFLDGAVAVDGEAERVAGAGGLAERRAEDARPAEILDQALGDLERAAVVPDILAEHDGLGALGKDLAQAEVERLRHRDFFRGGRRRFPGHGRGRRGEHIFPHAFG